MSEVEKNVTTEEKPKKTTRKSSTKTSAARTSTAKKSAPAPEPVIDPEVLKKMQEEKAKMKEDYFKNGLTDEQIYDIIDNIKDEDTKALARVMFEIKRGNDKEANYAKRQSIFSLCTAVFCLILVIVILVWGAKFVPTIENLAVEATELVENTNGLIEDTSEIVNEAMSVLDQATGMIDETSLMLDQTSVVIDNLETITSDLAKTDINGMMDNINSLVITSEESMSEAVGKIEAIDIESLNKAIKDLQGVVTPLSKLFRK